VVANLAEPAGIAHALVAHEERERGAVLGLDELGRALVDVPAHAEQARRHRSPSRTRWNVLRERRQAELVVRELRDSPLGLPAGDVAAHRTLDEVDALDERIEHRLRDDAGDRCLGLEARELVRVRTSGEREHHDDGSHGVTNTTGCSCAVLFVVIVAV